jgi:hypothetical protein
MRFWDSSAIVPLLTKQVATPVVEALLDADPQLLVWWGTPVECVSALARLERGGVLSHADVGLARARLTALAESWNEVQPHVRVRSAAERLLRVHPLRAGDALQLGAALEVCSGDPEGLDFVCFDQRLSEAASREGLQVIAEAVRKR